MISAEEAARCSFGVHPVTHVRHYMLKMSDGVSLAMGVFFPGTLEDLENTPFEGCKTTEMYNPNSPATYEPAPVILEYIPYRKDDYTYMRDYQRHVWFSSHGYLVVRLDIRGTGTSEGVCLDEYIEQEQKDACEFMDWISQQAWCNGNVGMYGKSWGGFNGLQLGYCQPAALKAAVCCYFSDDRFACDIHHKGGCMIASEITYWASRMHTMNAAPPHPHHAGPKWKEMWKERLQNASYPWLNHWVKHQFRDDYWKHGSICEDYSKVQCAILAIGGWRDPYRNCVFSSIQHLPKCRAIVGPFAHEWPDMPVPGLANTGYLWTSMWDALSCSERSWNEVHSNVKIKTAESANTSS